jgi:transposase-like protein
VKEKKVQKRYEEEFKRQAVELVIHSGKTQAQIARELGVSERVLFVVWPPAASDAHRGTTRRVERRNLF